MKRFLCACLMLCLILGFVGCDANGNVPGKTPSVSTSNPTQTQKTTAQPTATATPSPSPTVNPDGLAFTKSPITTPQPGTTQPPNPGDGIAPKKLFDENYYAVLPGEGAYYHVYDCYGTVVGMFQKPDGYYSRITGLYPKDSILFEYHFATLHEIDEGYDETSILTVNKTEHYYWTYDYRNSQICVYDLQDRLFYRTAPLPETENGYWIYNFGVLETTTGLLVYIYDAWEEGSPNIIEPVLVTWDGTVTKLHLKENMRLVGVLGSDYLIVRLVDHGWDDGSYAICDYKGTILVSDISPVIEHVVPEAGGEEYENAMAITTDWYVFQNRIYGADLQPIDATIRPEYAEFQRDWYVGSTYVREGQYMVNGILCEVDYEGETLFGKQNDTLLLVRNGTHFTLTCNPDTGDKLSLYQCGEQLAVLYDETYRYYLIRLSDGACLNITESGSYWLTSKYAIYRRWKSDADIAYYTVYDLQGNIRYETEAAEIYSTNGGLLVVERGPYIGIADLDGNYLLKTLVPSLAADHVPQQEEEYW